MIETVKTVGAVASAVSVTIALCSLLVKPVRKWLASKIRSVSREDSRQVEQLGTLLQDMAEKLDAIGRQNEEQNKLIHLSLSAAQASLGNSIKHIYYKYYLDKCIPIREKEAAILLHRPYNATGGNSFVDELFDEMMTWEVTE